MENQYNEAVWHEQTPFWLPRGSVVYNRTFYAGTSMTTEREGRVAVFKQEGYIYHAAIRHELKGEMTGSVL